MGSPYHAPPAPELLLEKNSALLIPVLQDSSGRGARSFGFPGNWYHSTCLFPPALLINPCTLFGRWRPQNSALAAGIAPNPNPTHGSLLHNNFIHSCIRSTYSGKCIWASSCFDSSAQTSLGSNNVSHIIITLF